MRSPLKSLSAMALCAATLTLSGCGTFFTYPGSSSSGSTTSYAYFANETTKTVSGYALDSGTPVAVTGSPYAALGIVPTSLVVTPKNTFLYVGGNGALYGYSINTTTGQLTALSSGQALASVSVVSMDVSPDGTWLLVLDGGGAAIDEYAINTSTGALTAATGASYSVKGNGASNPQAIRFAPSGGLVFAALGNGGDVVFTFNTSTGALTNPQNLAGSTTSSDNGLAIDSTSSYLYIARSGDGSGINVFTIGANGVLSSITGSPFAAGNGTRDIVIDKTGAYLYAANSVDSTISGFTITSSTGALTAISGSPFASGSSVNSLGRDSLGKYIIAASPGGSSDLSMYTFDTTTSGKLDLSKTSTTGTDPTGAIAVAMTH